LSIASGTPKPKVYVMRDASINAFATGNKPENAYVCVTTGLLQHLNRKRPKACWLTSWRTSRIAIYC